ncbi:hypothetical protein ZHAS_00018119 [Anopheles sinensis]|uniref:Uncharacterized protein n=1 Tax=Anopheles sinensis TaxID=74873 RepID=A0A084WIM5_ANOSI|nr:hypothetical protein ZHAS_00018119 [Anopheles sinensis]
MRGNPSTGENRDLWDFDSVRRPESFPHRALALCAIFVPLVLGPSASTPSPEEVPSHTVQLPNPENKTNSRQQKVHTANERTNEKLCHMGGKHRHPTL